MTVVSKRPFGYLPTCAMAATLILCLPGCRKEPEESAGSAKTVLVGSSSPQWFVDVTDEVGLNFTHETGATGKRLMPESIGSGAAIFDCDNDGDLDLYLANGAFLLDAKPTGDPPLNRLYVQESGGRFTDVTTTSGLGDSGYGMGVAIGDFDNDGDRDVYVTNYGADRLYRNEGGCRFTDVTELAGINMTDWSASAAFLDYDRDGYLDIYVCVYPDYNPDTPCTDKKGRPDYCGPTAFAAAADVLLHNNGDGTFTDVSQSSGIAAQQAYGLGVVSADFNDDGWPDIYVANDQQPNFLWINQQDGTFRDEALTLGVALNGQGMSQGSMGVIAADFDNDRDVDLFMTHLVYETNTLYRNLDNNQGFEDYSAMSGIAQSSIPFTGFGTVTFDADLDGHLDIAVVNGRVIRDKPLADCRLGPPWDEYAEPNLFYLNNGGGVFSTMDQPVAAFCHLVEVSRGVATGDIDNDGDSDMLVVNAQGPARLFRNVAPAQGNWLTIEAIDPRYNRDAIGALISVRCNQNWQTRVIHSANSFLSSSDPRAGFRLGGAGACDEIQVIWPDGLREQFPGANANQFISLQRGEGKPIE